MTAMSLTRAEAHVRARLLNVRSYTVHLDFTRGDEVFGSSTVVRFGCAEPGAETFADLGARAPRRVVHRGERPR